MLFFGIVIRSRGFARRRLARLATADLLPEGNTRLGHGADRRVAGGTGCPLGRETHLRHRVRLPAAVRLSSPILSSAQQRRCIVAFLFTAQTLAPAAIVSALLLTSIAMAAASTVCGALLVETVNATELAPLSLTNNGCGSM